MRKIVVFFLVLAVFGILSARSKFNESTIKAELRKPGVKLVAIDFYMTGCDACDAAIPEWKKLKKQYGDALKLIVVAPIQNGSCIVKDWRPDKMVCDEDIEIAESWGVKDFPQAFLYSWHNNDPLVQHGHVRDVEKAIKTYFKEIPRVVLDAGSSSRNLVPKVEEALRMNSKIELVSSAAEQKQLLALKKQSHQLNYDEDLKCELGKEISANSVLKITKEDGDLVLRLSSVEKSCTMAAATKSLSGDKDKLKTEVAAAVYELLSQMFGNISTPDEGAKPAKTQKPTFQAGRFGKDPDDWEIGGGEETIVKFESNPAGAVVIADGKLLCQSTPCSKMLTTGSHRIEISKDNDCYKEWLETITIEKNNKSVYANIYSRESAVKVYAQDEKGNDIDADVLVDDKKVGVAPGTFKVPLCSKEMRVKKSGYDDYSERLSLKEKQVKTFQAKLRKEKTVIQNYTYSEEKLMLAVMKFEDKTGKLSAKNLSLYVEYLRAVFGSVNKFYIVSKERQEREMIKLMKQNSYKSCNDKSCQIQLGQALSADMILRTTITSFAGRYTVISELIDLMKEATVKGAQTTFDGSEESLAKALDNIVEQITR